MPDVKISALPASTTPLAGTEVLPIVQSATTRQVSVANLTAGRAVSALSITASGLTSGRVTYAGTAGLLQDNAALTFDGTTLTATKFAGALNGTVGATTASTGAFTTLTSNGATTFTAGTASTSTTTGTAVITGGLGVSGRVNAANFDGIVGANTAAAGSFTTINASTSITNAGLTISRVTFAGASGLLSDSANLTWDNNTLNIVSPSNSPINLSASSTSNTLIQLTNANAAKDLISRFRQNAGGGNWWDLTMIGATNDFTFDYNDGEKVRITNAGNVGIGTSSPTSPTGFTTNRTLLQITNGSDTGQLVLGSTANGLMLDYSNSTGDANIRNGYGASAAAALINIDSGTLAFRTGTSYTERMRIASTGIVTMSAYGAGAATFDASGVISSVSDETWKTKDGVPTNTDAMLQKLEPGYWFYNEEKAPTFGEERQLGFYAQNVHEAIGEEAAPTPQEGKPWGYYDRSVLAVAVMSLKNALTTIEELKQRITALENK